MDENGKKTIWTRWGQWLLWWRTDTGEFRLQIEGYSTLPWGFAARQIGFLLSAIAAIQAACFAGVAFSYGAASLYGIAGMQAILAAGFAVPGWLLLRGSRVASLALMALYTFQAVFVAALAMLYLHLTLATASFLLASLVGWAIFMRVFRLALCVERSRKAVA